MIGKNKLRTILSACPELTQPSPGKEGETQGRDVTIALLEARGFGILM